MDEHISLEALPQMPIIKWGRKNEVRVRTATVTNTDGAVLAGHTEQTIGRTGASLDGRALSFANAAALKDELQAASVNLVFA
jgi:hypothetical protein